MTRKKPLRQFECRQCNSLWWERAGPKNNPSTQCIGKCKELKQAIPRGQEKGVGLCEFICECGHMYKVLCEKTDETECYNCGKQDVRSSENCRFYPPPRPRRRRHPVTPNRHSCWRCHGSGNCPRLRSYRNMRHTRSGRIVVC